MAFRTEAGREVDWFDDDFFLYYEDTDLSWRLRAAGWEIRYEPKAVVRHIHAASSVEWSPTFVFHSTRNRLLMLTKDASAARVRREWLGFLRETVNLLRFFVGAVRRGKRPPLQRLRMQLRVFGSLLRLTPAALRARRRIARSATGAADRARDAGWWPRDEGPAIYNRFWHSQGGGERHSGMIGQVLSQDGVEVDLDRPHRLRPRRAGPAPRPGPVEGQPAHRARSRRPGHGHAVGGLRPLGQRLVHEPDRPAVAKAAYLCYFPTPFDVDLPPVEAQAGRHGRAPGGGADRRSGLRGRLVPPGVRPAPTVELGLGRRGPDVDAK